MLIDGNVHTNIPVNSDDAEMLQTVYRSVERIMKIARSLGGVISGEHGIGITKLEFSPMKICNRFGTTKPSRPQAHLQPPQTDERFGLTQRLHAVFRAVGRGIADYGKSDLGTIADSVKDCLRCGKCKPVCSTHVPRANLLYSPRNKILGVGLLTDTLLIRRTKPGAAFPSNILKN